MGWVGRTCLFLLGMATAPVEARVESYRLADIKKIIRRVERRTGKPLTLNQFLPKLGKRFPDLREHYTLMRYSDSAQEAEPTSPRIIAFSKDARLVMALAGHPSFEGYHDLEVCEFNDQTEGFEFSRLSFPEEGAVRRVDFSAINSQSCTDCHRDDPRPNWEPYNFWPNAYGTVDQLNHYGEIDLSREDEAIHFSDFLKTNAFLGRYSILRGLDTLYQLKARGRRRLPNLELTQKLSALNFRRISRLVRQTPDYARYKFAIFAALLDCEDIESFLPETDRTHHAGSAADWLKDTEASLRVRVKNPQPDYHAPYVSKLRYLLEGRGISMKDWSMSHSQETYNFMTPLGHPMGGGVSALLRAKDADFADPVYAIYQLEESNSDEGTRVELVNEWRQPHLDAKVKACDALQTKSVEALTAR